MGPGGGAPLVFKGSLMRGCSGEITKKRDTSEIAEASRWRPPEVVAGGEPLRSQFFGGINPYIALVFYFTRPWLEQCSV